MTSQIEELIGGKISPRGIIAGTVAVSGLEVVYFSDNGRDSFHKQFNLLTQYTNPPNAQRGGATSQSCSLTLPDGSVFNAIAFHGDLEGWRKDIEEGARGLGLQLAKIEAGRFVISDGREYNLADCKPTFG